MALLSSFSRRAFLPSSHSTHSPPPLSFSPSAVCTPQLHCVPVAACAGAPARARRSRHHSIQRLQASSSENAAIGTLPQQGTGEEDVDAKNFALDCVAVLDETKCQDITVLNVSPLVTWCSYMVFATIMSRPQLLAALARVEKMASEGMDGRGGGKERLNQPGSSPWECLDYGSVVIHLFTQEQREMYDVEGFYAAAEEVEIPLGMQIPQGGPAWTSQQ